MANRPRRPSGGKPETVIDGEAERRPPSALASGTATDETVSGDVDTARVGEVGPIGASSERDVPREEPAIAVEEPSADVPPLVALSDVEADHDPAAARGYPGDDTVAAVLDPADLPASAETAAPAEAAFAREEGLTGEGAEASRTTPADPSDPVLAAAVPATPRRDLGEFEDDEPGTEPHREPEPTLAQPYTAPHESESRGTSFGSLLGAGLIGGLIVGAGGLALLSTGAVTLPSTNAQTINPQQFAAAGEVQQLNGDLQTLRGTVEQLQSAQAAGGAGAGGVAPADFTALTDRVSANERAIQSGGAASGDASTAAQGASEAAAAAQSAADGAREAATAAQGVADAARDTATQAQNAAQGAVSAAQGASGTAQDAQRVAGEAQGAVEAVRGEVASFGERLGAIEAANRRAALALSAAGLKAAIDRGTPFMGELERFSQSGDAAAAEAVGRLRDYAAAGVPTAQTLSADWDAAETAILQALRPPVSASDVGDQVLSGLRSLVTVRPSGTTATPGAQGPEAAVARMDAAVTAGDFAAWIREWDTLPDAAKQASTPFADKARARAEADRLIDQTINSAIGASASQG